MLRLAFYSDQLIPENQKVDYALYDLIGKPEARIGYISSSSDPSRQYFSLKQNYYQQYGLHLDTYTELDIEYKEDRIGWLFNCDAIHLSGGSTPYFLYWLQKRNLLEKLRYFARNTGVLIGVSAGAIILTPSIETTFICGDTSYSPLQTTTSLGLVDFSFIPHFKDTLEHDREAQKHANTYQRNVYGCYDGDGIIVQNGAIQLLGNVRIYRPEG